MKVILSILVLVPLLSGCGGTSGVSSGSGVAMLRVVNGVPGGTESLTGKPDGAAARPGVLYPMRVNGVCITLGSYVPVKSRGVSFAVELEGSSTNVVPSQFQNLNLGANTENTFVVSVGDGAGSVDGITGYLFQDNDIPVANSVQLRIVNATANVPMSLAAWVVPDGTIPSGNPTINNVALGSASSYITLPPNTYDIYFVGLNCGLDANCARVSAMLNANQNVTVYLLFEGSGSRPLILADN